MSDERNPYEPGLAVHDFWELNRAVEALQRQMAELSNTLLMRIARRLRTFWSPEWPRNGVPSGSGGENDAVGPNGPDGTESGSGGKT